MTPDDVAALQEAIAGLRHALEEFRQREFLPFVERNELAHSAIITKVDTGNGRLRELELWRAGIQGGIAVWVAVAVVCGGAVTATLMKVLEK